MPEGFVKWFSEKKGYGFIERAQGDRLFVHSSSINTPAFKILTEGDRVSFDVEVGDRVPQAINVKKIGERNPVFKEVPHKPEVHRKGAFHWTVMNKPG